MDSRNGLIARQQAALEALRFQLREERRRNAELEAECRRYAECLTAQQWRVKAETLRN